MSTIVIFDLEATCWEDGAKLTREDSEIIEIGAVRVGRETGEVIGTFQRFVKPHFNLELSDYCKNLTSIKQEDVNTANEFYIVLPEFNEWLGDDDEYIMSWGMYDKHQILREMTSKNFNCLEIELKLLDKHLNMKAQFSAVYNVKHCGLSKALKFLKLTFDGTHHRGIDDAMNMALIYKKVKDKFFGSQASAV